MKSWNTPDHHIADTEHGTLILADDVTLVIADWEVTENAPDRDGRVYTSVRGWLVNGGGTGRVDDPYTEPIDAGRARLVRTELRGREPVTDRDVHIDYHSVGRPYPNTWDHRGCQVTVSWMDRRIDAHGRPIPDQAPALTSPALAVACPACGSRPGALCTSHSGTRTCRHDVHRARTAALAATG
ncbi:hypothetical protein ACFC34_38170 [Streptomyces sp. NPDC056053]|uniref:zinc finger domain-containing protein n=1 Tax=Streptomyces sp. NPDC056053 TaxID=3345696 RepID=UPI0035DBBDEC